LEAAPARPRFAEIAEVPAYAPQRRDYAAEYGGNPQSTDAFEQRNSSTDAAVLSESDEEALRELDKPAFMRRSKF
jgi:hypothetical protein